ncbi:toxin Cry1Ac domain D-VI-related protein [Clostridium ihumii]|uniref:toxin Cry1Ac domain D-VI-related protein n=1 Tax=Clostridium ihumii TaxID=1470356 RepID=UPI003D339658
MRKRNKFVAALSIAAISALISSTVFADDGDIYNIDNKREIIKQYTSEEIAISKKYQKKVTLNSESFGYECSGKVYTLDEVNEIYNKTRCDIDRTLKLVETTLKDVLVVEDKSKIVIESVSEFNNSTIKVKFKNAVTENQTKEATITLIKDNKEYNAKTNLKKGDMEAEFKFDKDLNENGKYIIKGTEISVELKGKNEEEIVKEILDTKTSLEFRNILNKYEEKFVDVSYLTDKKNKYFELKELKKSELKTITDIQNKVIYTQNVISSFQGTLKDEIYLHDIIKYGADCNVLKNVDLENCFYIGYKLVGAEINDQSKVETIEKIEENIIKNGNIVAAVNMLFEIKEYNINYSKLGHGINKEKIDGVNELIKEVKDDDIKEKLNKLIEKAKNLLEESSSEKITASVSAITINGKIEEALNSNEIKITLKNDKFNKIEENTDVSSWFKNLPKGLTAKIKGKVEKDSQEATIIIGGTPIEPLSSAMEIEILAENLVGNTNVKVDENKNAKFEIKDLEKSVLRENQIIATTSIESDDKISFTGLSNEDKITVYDAESGMTTLDGVTSEIKEGKAEFIFNKKFQDEEKEVWVTIKSKDKKESDRIKVTMPSKITKLEKNQLESLRLKGEKDKILIKGLSNGDEITVYDSEISGNKIKGNILEIQEGCTDFIFENNLSDDLKNVWVTIKSVGKKESKRIKVTMIPEKTIINKAKIKPVVSEDNEGKIIFDELNDKDVVKAYTAATNGKEIKGDLIKNSEGKYEFTLININITYEFKIWITITSENKSESNPIEVTIPAKKSILELSQMKPHTVIGKGDNISFTGLQQGDEITVYDGANSSNEITGKLGGIVEGNADFTFVENLGEEAKDVWVKLRRGEDESERIKVKMPAEPQPSASVKSIALKGNVNEQIKAMDVEIKIYNDKFNAFEANKDVTSWFEGLPQGLKATVKQIKDNNEIIISIEGTPNEASNKEINITIPKDLLERNKDVKIYQAIKVNFYIKETVSTGKFTTKPEDNKIVIKLTEGKFKAGEIKAADFEFEGLNKDVLEKGKFIRKSDAEVEITGISLQTSGENVIKVKAEAQKEQAKSVTVEASKEEKK